MLVLQRKIGEKLIIGDSITVSVVSVDGTRVKLAIDAPPEISILRSELVETINVNKDSAINKDSSDELLSLLEDVLEHKNSN